MMPINPTRQLPRQSHVRLTLAIVAAVVLAVGESGRPTVHAQSNPIVVENQQTGATDWDISGAGDPAVQGFATAISVNTGETVDLKIKTDSTTFPIRHYRLG